MNVWLAYASGPLIGAAIGWATNWVAVRMLFRPRREVKILGVRFHGLIPKRRAELTRRAAEIVEEELINSGDVRKIVESADLASPILKVVEERVDQFLADQLAGLPKLVRRLLPRDLPDRIKRNFMLEIEGMLPRLTESMIEAMSAKADFKGTVVEKLDAVEVEKLEALVYRLARSELRSIELVGGVLGFAIGAFQSVWLWLLG
jgi:uncharacterized membrane protein YheB (UPF0754 family)